MWDDDYDDYSHDRPGRYEVRRVYLIDPRGHDIYRPPGESKFKFSPTEIQHLAIAYFVLVVCFSIVLATGIGGVLLGIFYPERLINDLIIVLPASFLAVGLGFILHEVGHKFMAQHYGCWSEFRYDQRGLLMALVISFLFGFVIAAPGATWVSGHITRRENGILSLAGPAINITIAAILIPISFISPSENIWANVILIGFIIGFLGAFNLIPFHPLDGSKIWRWDKGIYIISMIIALILVGFFYINLSRAFTILFYS